MKSNDQRWLRALRWTLCYSLWLALAVLGVVLCYELLNLAVALHVYFELNPWGLTATRNFSLVVLGLAWLGALFPVEEHLRQGVKRGDLWRRAGGMLLAELALFGLAVGFQAVLFR